MKNIIFITKDALHKTALPVYGNTYFRTPNIDELAAKGTVFNRHYTAGGSTAMAFTAMALCKYCYQTDRKLYNGKESSENGNTLFDRLYDMGYDVNIAWDKSYTSFSNSHFKCEGLHTTIHSLDNIIPNHPPHISGQFDDLTYKDDETEKGLKLIEDLFSSLKGKDKPVFLWLHLPHVFAGRNAYDSDIDVFDRIIGMARNAFSDDEIYISADHGQMNGHKGKFGYGFDAEESIVCIPLITPKFDGRDTVDFPTTNIQLDEIFGLKTFSRCEFIVSETAYYIQPHRKIAIIHGNFKLIYDKHTKKFGLYDVVKDSAEEHNLYYPEFYDTDRRSWYSLNQRFFYDDWATAMREKEILLEEYKKIWRNGTFFEELSQKFRFFASIVYGKLKQKAKTKHYQYR